VLADVAGCHRVPAGLAHKLPGGLAICVQATCRLLTASPRASSRCCHSGSLSPAGLRAAGAMPGGRHATLDGRDRGMLNQPSAHRRPQL